MGNTKTPRTGRPSTFTKKMATSICNQLVKGESLRKICEKPAMPSISTVMRWLGADKDFREQYACAREAQADRMAEEILQIADDGKNDKYIDEHGNERTDQDVVARSRLRVDARKWLASKMAPKKYGDKLEVSGDPAAPVLFERIERRIVDPAK